jgi:SulP family sulfate permease
MYYANSELLAEEITDLANHADPPLRWLCIDASAVDDVDYTAAETLRSLFTLLHEKGVRLVVAHVLEDVAERSRYHLRELFGADAFYATLGDVVSAYRQHVGQQEAGTPQ